MHKKTKQNMIDPEYDLSQTTLNLPSTTAFF